MKLFVALFLLSINIFAETKLDFVLQYGAPILDRKEASKNRINELIWCGDQHVVYLTDIGSVNCLSIKDKKVIWSKAFKSSRGVGLSYNNHTGHIAITEPILSDRKLHIIEVKTGNTLKSIEPNKIWKNTIGSNIENFAFFMEATYLPNNQGLLLGFTDQDNNKKFLKLSKNYSIAKKHESILIGEEKIQEQFAVEVNNSFARAISLTEKKEIFIIGKRPDKNRIVIGPAFYSHGFTDGKTVILSQDGGCFGKGSIEVYSLPSIKPFTFLSNCHHMEIAVNFDKSWIAITGTNQDLVLFDFKGNKLATAKEISKQRNLCLSLSPNGKLLAVGSWDTTLKVYEVQD